MRYLVYRSFAIVPAETSADIFAILRQSRHNNPRLGITGYLYHERGKFFQYIEGSQSAVSGLMDRIAADERHCAVQILGTGWRETRLFGDWDMGFERAEVSACPLEGEDPSIMRSADDVITFLDGLRHG